MNQAHMRVAIVGGATLKGRELAELLNERNFPARDIRLLDDDESLGQLEAMGDEVTFVQSVNREQFERVDIAFFASDEKFTGKNWQMARDAGCAIVDMSYALETQPGSVVRAPWIERELGQVPPPELQPAPMITAHPAATVLALLLLRAHGKAAIRTAAATVIEPASEHGRRGMDELHEQTVNLLSFKELPKQVFDQQVAFNMLARYGPGSSPTLESTEQRIRRHFQKVTAGQAPVPALLLLQGPSFHGHAFAIYIEFEWRLEAADLSRALAGEHVNVTVAEEDSPTNVNAAGQNDVLVALHPDAQRENGFWIWASADNLRVTVLTAIDCAESIAMARPKGKVQ
jgi:aspartate-semialdehyde dehydrogenase